MKITAVLRDVAATGVLWLASAAPAWAGTVTPGPVVGAGAPALALVAGGYWLIRRRARR